MHVKFSMHLRNCLEANSMSFYSDINFDVLASTEVVNWEGY